MAKRLGVSRRRSAEEWQQLLMELAESGESVERFCRRFGLHPPTLRWWRWKLADGEGATESRAAAASRPPQFTEIRWPEPVMAGGRSVGFELRWSDGLTLRIPSEFDEGSLRRLLGVLEAVGC
jgi:transposase-like protein